MNDDGLRDHIADVSRKAWASKWFAPSILLTAIPLFMAGTAWAVDARIEQKVGDLIEIKIIDQRLDYLDTKEAIPGVMLTDDERVEQTVLEKQRARKVR